jgi:hypothetical protein
MVIALTAIASLAGIYFSSTIYPTQELRQAFVPNDWVNIILAIPVLLGSMWLPQRGGLIGLLCLPGALFYVVYNYVAYAAAVPWGVISLLYLALVVLSVYTMIRLVASIDANTVRQRLNGAVPARLSAGVLIGFGILFFLRAIGVIFNSHTTTDFAVAIADLVITPAWIIGGVLLWRRTALGYVFGAGLLFQASLLFIGLIIVLLIQPLLTTKLFVFADVAVIFIMGLFCFVPFGLFARGANSQEHKGGHNESRS